jgi:integrase
MAMRQRAVLGDEVTYVVLDRHWQVVGPAEEYLEHLRQEQYSPNTVRAYAQGLALWWSMLEDRELTWSRVDVHDLARFKRRLENRGTDPTVIALRPDKPAAASTVDVALTAVLSFYRYQALTANVPAARQFYEHVKGGIGQARAKYASFLGHLGGGQAHRVIGRRRDPKTPPPFLTPVQITVIKDDAARFDHDGGRWSGDLRLRLFWTLLEETGLRLAEALLLRHRDWQPGTGTTAFLEVQPREDQRRRLRVKNQQYRRVYLSDELDDLYGEYLFLLVELGLDVQDDDRSSSTCFAASSADRCGRRRSTTGSRGSNVGIRCCRRGGRRTGFGTATPRRCCWPGCRSMWCSGDWGTATSTRC